MLKNKYHQQAISFIEENFPNYQFFFHINQNLLFEQVDFETSQMIQVLNTKSEKLPADIKLLRTTKVGLEETLIQNIKEWITNKVLENQHQVN